MTINLTLGSVTFSGFEIPERINFGGSQAKNVHRIIGGQRQVDTMGAEPDDISWSGRFRGPTAMQRALALDSMRILGQPVTLSWDTITRQVIIDCFQPTYERPFEITYRIICTVCQAEVAPTSADPTTDSLVSSDLGGVGSLISGAQSSLISAFSDISGPLSSVSTYLGQANTAISGLGTLTGQSFSTLSKVLSPLNSAQSALNGAIAIGDGNISTGASEIGNVIPGNGPFSATQIPQQIAALQQLSNLIVARGQLGRAVTNTNAA